MGPSRGVTPSWSTSRSQQCPAAITPTERQGGVCGYVTRTQRLPSSEEAIVQPSVTRQHKKRRPQSVEQKQREEKNDPKSRQHLHAWRASCSRVSISARDAKGVTPSPSHSCRALRNYLFLCVRARWRSRKRSTGRQINTARGTAGQQRCMRYGTTSTITHGGSTHHPQKQKKTKKTRRQGVWLCVALRVSARPGRNKNKTKEGKKCVLRPTGTRRTPTRHGSLSAPFVAAPPHACSRRGAQGRRHERVGGCASGAVGRETHGTPRRKSAATNN
ncbi:hypothetical protein TCDM_13573 [Trypanosoma cruzi Dm28c]|uniref:Uncharacterized protein n=1 Tax=Trypanosoma cruzi Dm28c TaxID=1416333 RepID=V5CHY9_TRYCR|nr:hypothetical protein TCDM_13573 [Trypanosoma cruzi Dm28c]